MFLNKKISLIILVIFLFIFSAVFCCSCTPIDSGEIFEALLPNMYVFMAHLIACVILLTLTIWLIWKPTKNALEKRRNYIANEIRLAEENRKLSYIKLQEAEQEKLEAHSKAQAIVAEAINQSYYQKEVIENEANLNAKKIYNDSINEAEKLKIKVKSDVEKQAIDIIFSITENLIKTKHTEKEDKEIIDEFIHQLNKENND